jgi:hypothetical protein
MKLNGSHLKRAGAASASTLDISHAQPLHTELLWTDSRGFLRRPGSNLWSKLFSALSQGDLWIYLVAEEDRCEVAALWERSLSTRNPFHADFRNHHADGLRWLRACAIHVSASGEVGNSSWAWNFRDCSAEYRLRQKVCHAAAEFGLVEQELLRRTVDRAQELSYPSESNCALARCSAMRSKVSSRCTSTCLGASMPMRTLRPFTASTCTQTSGPIISFSPTCRVNTSIKLFPLSYVAASLKR